MYTIYARRTMHHAKLVCTTFRTLQYKIITAFFRVFKVLHTSTQLAQGDLRSATHLYIFRLHLCVWQIDRLLRDQVQQYILNRAGRTLFAMRPHLGQIRGSGLVTATAEGLGITGSKEQCHQRANQATDDPFIVKSFRREVLHNKPNATKGGWLRFRNYAVVCSKANRNTHWLLFIRKQSLHGCKMATSAPPPPYRVWLGSWLAYISLWNISDGLNLTGSPLLCHDREIHSWHASHSDWISTWHGNGRMHCINPLLKNKNALNIQTEPPWLHWNMSDNTRSHPIHVYN